MDNQLRNTNKVVDLAVVIVAVLAIPSLATVVTGIIYPNFGHLDPDETFLFITLHHLVQLVLTIILMLALSKRLDLGQWGFNLQNKRQSLKWIGAFFLVFGLIEYFRLRGNPAISFEYPLTLKNTTGIQFFQYVLSGLGEEPLFRGFVMVFLARHWSKIYRIGKLEFPITIAIATALFMIAHLEVDFTSVTISGFDFDQQMKALQLGVLYGLAFFHTKSLLAPIVMHGLSNGLQFTMMYYLLP